MAHSDGTEGLQAGRQRARRNGRGGAKEQQVGGEREALRGTVGVAPGAWRGPDGQLEAVGSCQLNKMPLFHMPRVDYQTLLDTLGSLEESQASLPSQETPKEAAPLPQHPVLTMGRGPRARKVMGCWTTVAGPSGEDSDMEMLLPRGHIVQGARTARLAAAPLHRVRGV